MSRNVRFKLSGPELAAAVEFADTIGLPLDIVARQSLFMTIEAAYRTARNLGKESTPNGIEHHTENRDHTRDHPDTGSSSSGDALEEAGDVADQ